MELFEIDDEDEGTKEESVRFDRSFQFMDLLKPEKPEKSEGENRALCFEKQHMFDKVVTPSDVGKLNRLVIPKQHAEKYFPLDSSSNEKGLLLNFEDRTGKQWRFRYSYWNSSQSYVMTKGWSRFVKDKKLDAGDVVSFERGVGEIGKDLLFIDWKRRPDVVKTTSFLPVQFPEFVRWGRGSPSKAIPIFRRNECLQQMGYNSVHPYYFLRPSSSGQMPSPAVVDGSNIPVVMNSVKRLRLFGVNMECPTTSDENLPASSLAPGGLGFQNDDRRRTIPPEFFKKGKSSLSFDLDL